MLKFICTTNYPSSEVLNELKFLHITSSGTGPYSRAIVQLTKNERVDDSHYMRIVTLPGLNPTKCFHCLFLVFIIFFFDSK